MLAVVHLAMVTIVEVIVDLVALETEILEEVDGGEALSDCRNCGVQSIVEGMEEEGIVSRAVVVVGAKLQDWP